MELRHLLNILRRHVWITLQATLLVAFASGLLSSLRTPVYRADASVLLRPNDPAEQLNPANGQRAATDPDRYVEAQATIAKSTAVARAATESLRGVTAADITRSLSVEQGGRSDILRVSVHDTDPVRARDITNAVVRSFIENRRQSAVVGLQQAADEIQGKLLPLQQSIAQLDAQIGEGSTDPAATSKPQAPVAPAWLPSSPPAAPVAGVNPGGQPTTTEALKAARYAAAVQYETLFSRQQELLVDIALKRGEAELIADATTPQSPVSPRPVRDTVLGAVVGLLLGVGIGLLREQLQDRVRSADEVEKLTNLPVLAQLPFDDESSSKRAEVAAISRPTSPLTEAVRSLRTSVQYLATEGPIKVVLITSAVPGEGKSLVAANLAAVYARAGHRTVVISADLRRSGISRLFGVPLSAPGLTNVVTQYAGETAHSNGSGRAARAQASTITMTPPDGSHPSLTYLPSGPTPPNPAELLGSKRMLEVLRELSDAADVVIIDTPPLLPVTDAAVLAAHADGVVLVASVGETRREALRRAVAVLQGTRARVLGVAVNKVPKRSGSYDYSYYAAPDPDSKRRRRRSHEPVPERPTPTRRRDRRAHERAEKAMMKSARRHARKESRASGKESRQEKVRQ